MLQLHGHLRYDDIYDNYNLDHTVHFESDTNQALNSRGSSEDGCHVKCQHEHFDINKVKRNILSH